MLVPVCPKVTVTFVDAKGRSAYTSARLPLGTSLSAAHGLAETLAGILASLSNASVVKYGITYGSRADDVVVPRSALIASPQAQFIFSLTDQPDHLAEITIPLDNDWIVADPPLGGFAIDLANAEVIEFTVHMRDGSWCDPFGTDYADVYSAHIREIE